jgi:hypothetical protein
MFMAATVSPPKQGSGPPQEGGRGTHAWLTLGALEDPRPGLPA